MKVRISSGSMSVADRYYVLGFPTLLYIEVLCLGVKAMSVDPF